MSTFKKQKQLLFYFLHLIQLALNCVKRVFSSFLSNSGFKKRKRATQIYVVEERHDCLNRLIKKSMKVTHIVRVKKSTVLPAISPQLADSGLCCSLETTGAPRRSFPFWSVYSLGPS